MYKQDLVLNNLQGLICHKTTNQHSIYNDFSIFFEKFYLKTVSILKNQLLSWHPVSLRKNVGNIQLIYLEVNGN